MLRFYSNVQNVLLFGLLQCTKVKNQNLDHFMYLLSVVFNRRDETKRPLVCFCDSHCTLTCA